MEDSWNNGVRKFTINFRNDSPPPDYDAETAELIAAAQSTEDYYTEEVNNYEECVATEGDDQAQVIYVNENGEVIENPSEYLTNVEENVSLIETEDQPQDSTNVNKSNHIISKDIEKVGDININKKETNLTKAINKESDESCESTDESEDEEGFDSSNDQKSKATEPGIGKTVAEHYNQKECGSLETRQFSRIFYMRNFNNWTKSMLIDEFLTKCKSNRPLGVPLKVLDMGCGKGGDMLKWINGSVSHVIFADIAEVSIEHCKTRYGQLKTKEDRKPYPRKLFSAQYIAADCSKTRLRSHYEDKGVEIDLVSCQFCIHYSFESLHQAKCMLKNAAECLKVGGYFIGTVPDSNEIVARQRLSKTKQFGNDVYQIKCLFDVNKSIPLFGAKYDFNLEGVVNCPEFLVQFSLFEKLASDYGLKLILKENFRDFYERKVKDLNGLELLTRMNALEMYPPTESEPKLGNDEDYYHADLYLEEHNNEKVGTLSRSEWDAITLYQVFAFEKVKGESNKLKSHEMTSSSSSSSSTNKRIKLDET